MLPLISLRSELLRVPKRNTSTPDMKPNKALFGLIFNVFMFKKLFLISVFNSFQHYDLILQGLKDR